MTGEIDLTALLRRLATRTAGRSEATVQADIRALLLGAELSLDEEQLEDIQLEAPVGKRRRIDIEVGRCVIEVKRDLSVGSVLVDAVDQLADYVAVRTATLGVRYVGIVTDGCEWHAYTLHNGQLRRASSHAVAATRPDVRALTLWLDGALATFEGIVPTPRAIADRLGSKSAAYALDRESLAALYERGATVPSVALKRQLWAKLLTTAYGSSFDDSDALFVEHSLLVASAEIIAHALLGFDLVVDDLPPALLLSGAKFREARLYGVVEEDFFDWILEVDGGPAWVEALARRLSRFDWTIVHHDVLKVLYESVIDADQRHSLGEYYTPDWLAQHVIETVVDSPLDGRVLDPACGSGTFLFHAIRRHLDAAEKAGLGIADALTKVTTRVVGMDVHPVAVTFARVTYLLAIGTRRLRDQQRPALSVPVYLGDSLQWGQEQTLFNDEALVVATDDGLQFFADELKFPTRLMTDVGRFDRLVIEMSHRAVDRKPGSAKPNLSSVFSRHAVHPDDQPVLQTTFEVMCRLHDENRDHIWSYYVRNLSRPAWLTRLGERADVLVGNPPWLAYRHMTAAQQQEFADMSRSRQLWSGATVATHQDLSTLFLVRSAELYLRDGGSFGMVLPHAVISRNQYQGFRSGKYPSPTRPIGIDFDEIWELHQVKPSFFPVPGCVITGKRVPLGEATTLEHATHSFSGRLPEPNMGWDDAAECLTVGPPAAVRVLGERSAYAARFSQGATIVPRALFMVNDVTEASPLGAGAGRVHVRSARSPFEKKPWKTVADLTGSVETPFVRDVHLGSTILPFALARPGRAVLPVEGSTLLSGDDPKFDLYPGLADWWRTAERVWRKHRSSDRLTLLEQLDYRSKLTNQLPAADHRVVYTKSGMYVAASRISDPEVIIDHKLYWGATASIEEARYLTAILNSTTLTELVRPLQARGEHNPRDFDKYVWNLPIPIYDPESLDHQRLVSLAAQAEDFVQNLNLPNKRFETQRSFVREQLTAGTIGTKIDERVADLLGSDQDAT